MYSLAINTKSKLSVICLCICNSKKLFNVFSVILDLANVNNLLRPEKVRSEVDEVIGNVKYNLIRCGDVQMTTCLDTTLSYLLLHI